MRRMTRGLLILVGLVLLIPTLLAEAVCRTAWACLWGLDRLYTRLELED